MFFIKRPELTFVDSFQWKYKQKFDTGRWRYDNDTLRLCTHTTVLSRFRCSGTLYHGDIAVCTPQTDVARLLACFLYQGTIRFSIIEIPCHASTILFSANVIAERAIFVQCEHFNFIQRSSHLSTCACFYSLCKQNNLYNKANTSFEVCFSVSLFK